VKLKAIWPSHKVPTRYLREVQVPERGHSYRRHQAHTRATGKKKWRVADRRCAATLREDARRSRPESRFERIREAARARRPVKSLKEKVTDWD